MSESIEDVLAWLGNLAPSEIVSIIRAEGIRGLRPRMRPVNPSGREDAVDRGDGMGRRGAGATRYADGEGWALFQWRGSKSARWRLGWVGIRSRTSQR